MLAQCALIIRNRPKLYLLIALLFTATVAFPGILMNPAFVLYVNLSAYLPVIIFRSLSLSDTPKWTPRCQQIACFKTVIILSPIVASAVCVTLYARRMQPVFDKTPNDLELAGVLVLLVAAILTLLGSWVPAGIVRTHPGIGAAVTRGIRSFPRVYWRLAASLGSFLLIMIVLRILYVLAMGRFPQMTRDYNHIDLAGIAYWYLITLFGLFALAYIHVVITMDYLRSEKIDLARAPLTVPA